MNFSADTSNDSANSRTLLEKTQGGEQTHKRDVCVARDAGQQPKQERAQRIQEARDITVQSQDSSKCRVAQINQPSVQSEQAQVQS